MSNYSDFKDKNTKFTGTEGITLPIGTTAQRGSATGQLRYNSTSGKFEGRNGAGSFISIEVSPQVSSVNSSNITQTQIDAGFDLVLTGQNFASGDTVIFIASDNSEYISPTVTIDSDTQITARVNSDIDSALEPYAVKVLSSGGLTGSLASAFNIDASPVWQTASGSIGSIFDGGRSSVSLSATATDDESDAITYSIQSGSLPTGLSLNASTGAITGSTSAVVSDTTSNFTLRATSGTQTSDRAFSITQKAPVEEVFSYTGANQTFTVPSGLSSLTAYVFGAGGGGATNGGWSTSYSGGGGGAAVGTVNTSSISSIIVIVGQGGEGNDSNNSTTIRDAFGGGGGNNTTSDNQYSGGGAGLSGLFNGSYTHGNSLLIAGGGGGGGNTNGSSVCNGGAGGGTTGADGQSTSNTNQAGRGGTQSAGGSGTLGDNSNSDANGSALQGGKNPSSNYGGGGGGGYYGGGAGAYQGSSSTMGGGGGGSGYLHPTLVSSGTLYQGSGTTPGNSGSSYRNGAGDGGSSGGGDGDNGRVVLVY